MVVVAKKRGRPAGSGKVQQLENDLAGWRQRAQTAEHELAHAKQMAQITKLDLERSVADARKLAKDTTAKLNTMYDVLQAALGAIMSPRQPLDRFDRFFTSTKIDRYNR